MNLKAVLLILPCLFWLCSANKVLDLGLKAYGGENIYSARRSDKYGYFAGQGSVLKIDLETINGTFLIVGSNYDESISNPKLFLYDEYVYLAIATNIRKYDAATLKEIDSISVGYYIYSAQVSGHYAFLATGNGTLFSVKKLDLLTLEVVSTVGLSPGYRYPNVVFVYQNYVYLRSKDHILRQLDASSLTTIKDLNYSSYSASYYDSTAQFGQYGYIAGREGNIIIKIDLNTLTIVKSDTFSIGINSLILSSDGISGYITPSSPEEPLYTFDTSSFLENEAIYLSDYGYNYQEGVFYENKLFIASKSSYSNIIQIDLNTRQITDAISLLANSRNPLYNSVSAEGYGYFVTTNNIPSTIVKIDLNSWKIVARVTVPGRYQLTAGVYYKGSLFYATYNDEIYSSNFISIVRVSTAEMKYESSLEIPDYIIDSAIVVGNKGYFAKNTNIHIIDLDKFTIVNAVTVNVDHNLISPIAKDQFIYYGSSGDVVYKYDTTNDTVVNSVELPDSTITTGFIYGDHLYFLALLKLYKIDPNTLKYVGYVDLSISPYASCQTSVVIGNYSYIGCYTHPGLIAQVDLTSLTLGKKQYIDSGTTVLMTNDANNLIAGGDALNGKVYMVGADEDNNKGSTSTNNGGLSTGAIVGIIIGGAVFLILIVVLIVWLIKRRK